MRIYIISTIILLLIAAGYFYEKKLIDINKNEIAEEIKEKIEIQKQRDLEKENKIKNKKEEQIGNKGNDLIEDNYLINDCEKEGICENTLNYNKLEKEDTLIQEQITNIKLIKSSYSSNIDNLIKITGNNLDKVEYINIGEYSYKPEYIDGSLYFVVSKNNYLDGEYLLIFQLYDKTLKTYNDKIKFKFSNSKLVITDITPSEIKNDIARNIILQGKGLSKVISIQLSNNIVLEDTSFDIINDNVMRVIIPKKMSPGYYSLNIMETSGIQKSDININILEK